MVMRDCVCGVWCVCVCLYETEVEFKWRDIVERLGALALRAAAVCSYAVLSFSHQVAQFYLNIPPGLALWRSTTPTVSEEVKFCQHQPVFFWNDVCV